LALGDIAFEILVVKGMIFDVDSEPFFGGVGRWAFWDGPGF
jgi:hypothetical protein